jgi:DNA-binding response OmpR family regulator
LLAEEHDATRAFLQDNLSADGYRVLVAPDRAKALALLSTAHPDLIVVDVNGQTLELLDAVRSADGIAGPSARTFTTRRSRRPESRVPRPRGSACSARWR